MTGLISKKNLLPGELTYADRKCLELTRALATIPNLLLLDEIASGLNETETNEMIKVIREIRKLGTTMIIVEHVMDFIVAISDRLMVINQGQKVADGPPQYVIIHSALSYCA